MHEFVQLMVLAFVLAAAGNFITVWEHYRIFPGRVVRAREDSLPVFSEVGVSQIFSDENREIETIQKTKRGEFYKFYDDPGIYPANAFDLI